MCCIGAVALGATLWSPEALVGADPVASLQQQATALSQEMVREQLQVNAFEQQRAADMAKVTADDVQLQHLQVQLDAARRRIATDLSDLRGAAVRAYVQGGTLADGTSSLFSSTSSNGATAVYAEVMSGDLQAAVAKLQSDRKALRAEEATQSALSAAAQQQLQRADGALAAAQSTEQQLAQQRANVTGNLAAAIAQQQAQEAAAARTSANVAAQATQSETSFSGYSGSGAPAPSPPVAPASTGGVPQLNAFLRCVVQAESSGNYQAISPTGQYMGAFQFSQPTWNEAARLAGMPTLIGVPPYRASPRDQDLLAIALYNADGEQPWYDPCRN
jgi:peptidoglycan hydrolase CwlO-like protein